MPGTDTIQPVGERARKALRWVSEMLAAHPEKSRAALVREAEVRFDLTPKECAYLEKG